MSKSFCFFGGSTVKEKNKVNAAIFLFLLAFTTIQTILTLNILRNETSSLGNLIEKLPLYISVGIFVIGKMVVVYFTMFVISILYRLLLRKTTGTIIYWGYGVTFILLSVFEITYLLIFNSPIQVVPRSIMETFLYTAVLIYVARSESAILYWKIIFIVFAFILTAGTSIFNLIKGLV